MNITKNTTIHQMQAAVDEIREVCLKHGVILLGSCISEGIGGEIQICISNSQIGPHDINQLTNTVVQPHSDFFCVTGIGDYVGSQAPTVA